MTLIDLKCQDCIGSTTDGCYVDCEEQSLPLGQSSLFNYLIYLYFDLPPSCWLKYLTQARLILFKIPIECKENPDKSIAEYSASPLLDFFSVYRCAFSEPDIDIYHSVYFQDTASLSYTEVDLTSIVKCWIEGSIENKGLLLTGNKHTQKILYASNQYCITGMRPKLRLIYEEGHICQTLSEIPCIVEVKR